MGKKSSIQPCSPRPVHISANEWRAISAAAFCCDALSRPPMDTISCRSATNDTSSASRPRHRRLFVRFTLPFWKISEYRYRIALIQTRMSNEKSDSELSGELADQLGNKFGLSRMAKSRIWMAKCTNTRCCIHIEAKVKCQW